MNPSNPLVCFCNKVSEEQIRKAITAGAHNLTSIYDACGAGTGPCGGSCRKSILSLVNQVRSPHSPSTEKPLPLAFVEGISLFNRRYYWECHEILEDLWMVERGDQKLFYQGLIQSAAALYHVLNANPQGVIKLCENGLKKLQNFAPVYMSVDLSQLISDLDFFLQEAKDILAGVKTGFNYDKLPKILLGEEMREP